MCIRDSVRRIHVRVDAAGDGRLREARWAALTAQLSNIHAVPWPCAWLARPRALRSSSGERRAKSDRARARGTADGLRAYRRSRAKHVCGGRYAGGDVRLKAPAGARTDSARRRPVSYTHLTL